MNVMPAVKLSGADFFLNEDGSEFHYVGMSDFGLWKRFNMDNGPEALVRPILIERRQIADLAGYRGPIVLRVFRYSHPDNPFGLLPSQSDFSKINSFLDMCAEYNFYVDFTCGDSQHVLPNVIDQQNWLNQFTNNVQRFCFMETCNEPFKNGELPQNGVKPASSVYYLRDSGNYINVTNTIPWEYKYDLDFISYHGTRSSDLGPRFPKWLWDMTAQAATLRHKVGRPLVLKEPIGFHSINQPGRRYNDTYLAKCLGALILYCGQCFHSQLGLQSDGFDDSHKEAAFQYFAGVAGALR
jgi:hypothetical protein